MSLMTTLLLAFAPSAIAARRRDDEVEKLRKERDHLRDELELALDEVDKRERELVRLRETLNRTGRELVILQDRVARLNHSQAAMAQAAMLQQMQAQQAPAHPLGQHQLLQYNQQVEHHLLGLQQQNWQGEDYCNCVPDRAQFLNG